MREFIRSRIYSFSHAFAGLKYVIHTQKNAWIHLAATILILLISFWLRITVLEIGIVFLAIGIVWISELFNTTVEILIDLVSPKKNPLAKAGKDVGAAAVLISAFVAAIIGLLIIGPPLVQKLIEIYMSLK
jgi:diacylglycerol kinase (ATP)